MRKRIPWSHLLTACLATTACTTVATGTGGNACDVAPVDPGEPSLPVDQRIAQDRAEHLALRTALGTSLPTAETMVLVMLTSSHHTTTQLSFVATRDNVGRWTVNRTGRTTSALATIAPENEPVTTTELSPFASAEMDRLLADSCPHAQPNATPMVKLPRVGEWGTGLAVVTPKRRYAASAFGPIPAPGGRIVSLVTGW